MRLNFCILWFDDSEDYFDSVDLEPLRKEILSWGFSPDIKTVTTPEDFYVYSPFNFFDLIVIDRNLEQYKDGQEFISELRDHAVYTEVIFYTVGGVNALWDAIREKQLEGVFVSHRSDILSKIYRVGRQSIRKVLDLENIRGIVMAEVGELDHIIEEIIITGVSTLSEEIQNTIFKRFYETSLAQNQSTGDRLLKFSKNPEIHEMLNLCDSEKRWQNFNRLWRYHHKLKENKKIGNFTEDVIKPRNFLAHGRPQLQKDGSYIFCYQGKEYSFNDQVSNALRQTILRYKQSFSDILAIVSS